MVIITKRHPYFVGKKLRVGALLISLTGISLGCTPITTCYMPIIGDKISIDQTDLQTGKIILNRSISDTLSGRIEERKGPTFSYAILDSTRSLKKKDDIFALDGIYDEPGEEFKILVDKSIIPGDYSLRFYTISKDSLKNYDSSPYSFTLSVVDSIK